MTAFPTSLSAPSSKTRWLADVFRRVLARHAARRTYRTTYSDLMALDDHLLRDMGLTRDAIRDAASSGAARTLDDWRTTGTTKF